MKTPQNRVERIALAQLRRYCQTCSDAIDVTEVNISDHPRDVWLTVRGLLGELAQVSERHGRFPTAHHGLGVILEEVDELRVAVHENDTDAQCEEVIDIAVACLRYALDMYDFDTA